MIVLTALLLAGAPADSPRGFLTRLYARYEKGDVNPAREASVYTPELIREMRLNGRLHGPEEVGLIDYDPVCQCQDMADLKARIGEVTATGAGRARAKVSVGFGSGSSRQLLRLELARTRAGWRIADVGTQEQASLLAELRRDNRKMMRGK